MGTKIFGLEGHEIFETLEELLDKIKLEEAQKNSGDIETKELTAHIYEGKEESRIRDTFVGTSACYFAVTVKHDGKIKTWIGKELGRVMSKNYAKTHNGLKNRSEELQALSRKFYQEAFSVLPKKFRKDYNGIIHLVPKPDE